MNMKIKILALLFLMAIPLGMRAQMDARTRDNLMKEAYGYFKAGDYANARDKFKAVRNNSLSDDEAQAMYDTCQIFINTVNAALDCEKKRDYAGAIGYYQKIIDRNPTDRKTQEMLESCILRQYEPKLLEARRLYDEGSYDEALKALNDYKDLTGKTDEGLQYKVIELKGYNDRARDALDKNNLELAKDLYGIIKEKNPTDVNAVQTFASLDRKIAEQNPQYVNKGKVNAEAMAMSLIPGLGLIQKGHSAGYVYMGSEIALCFGGVMVPELMRKSYINKRNNATNASIRDHYTDKANQCRKVSIVCGSCAGVLYIVNLVHSYVAKPKPGARLQWDIAPMSFDNKFSTDYSIGVSLTYNF